MFPKEVLGNEAQPDTKARLDQMTEHFRAVNFPTQFRR